ncbi:MAG TPA: class I SAM-dependent rRNA methyltransferase [Pirellulaceae bacterium]|nr:class I SAM-dependent rRNA methyltransferase [Pirellulaceae bacterium]
MKRPPVFDEATEPAAIPQSAARVHLRPRKALPFYGRHPWVLDSAIAHVEPKPDESLDGAVVDLLNDKGVFIARGFFNGKSRIRMRLATWDEHEAIDESFFRRRIAQAILLREQIGYEMIAERETSASRLVFSESDGLSGLIVDRYGQYLVLQATSLAIAQRLEMIQGILFDLLKPHSILLRTEKSMAKLEGAELVEGHYWGQLPEGPITIVENGIRFQLDLSEGQKTGFYLDQRENRRAAAALLRGRRVLDLFCYTGGFSLAAAKLGGAKETLGIDGSKRAIAQAVSNAELNALPQCKFDVADGFKTLDALTEEGAKFDAVVLDPPKFARNRSGISQALMAYHRINRAAVELLTPGGILVTCSCSGSVPREDFLLMLSGVAQKSGRDIQILEVRGAAPDHPVSATCLETEYLKCVICRVA